MERLSIRAICNPFSAPRSARDSQTKRITPFGSTSVLSLSAAAFLIASVASRILVSWAVSSSSSADQPPGGTNADLRRPAFVVG